MKRTAALLIAGATLALTFGTAASAQAAAPATPSSTDLTFVHDNAQTDLAEITVGNIALTRAQSGAAKDLASTTISDHQAALAKLKVLAANLNVSLPTAPNAAQQADAATLKAVAADEFDATYAHIQIAGHQLSIAGTNTEISAGSDATVKSYASGYLPVAQMHLSMSESLLATVGGTTPTAVPAGTGGAGATTSPATRIAQLTLGVLGLVLIGFAAAAIVRRRVS